MHHSPYAIGLKAYKDFLGIEHGKIPYHHIIPYQGVKLSKELERNVKLLKVFITIRYGMVWLMMGKAG